MGWKEIDLKILTRGNWMEGGAFHWVLREKLSWDGEQVGGPELTLIDSSRGHS